MNRPDHEIDAYLEGELTAEQARTLEAWINASPEHAADFLHLIQTHQTLGILGKENRLARQTAEVKPNQLDPVTLAALAEMEASADTITVPAQGQSQDDRTTVNNGAGSLSANDFVKAGSYLLRHALTPKVITAFAAVLIIGLTLLIALTGNDTPEPRTADEASEPGRNGPARTNIVATLTAERDAVWSKNSAEGASAPGSPLRAGQKLALTQGYAEISTIRGAVAILQAPATIEFTDHDNAIRLHAGRLVGICETDASKGFLVHTPHLQVTDLGTRFGVAASADTTEVHVFEGEVQAERLDAPFGTEPTLLTTNQSARTSAGDAEIARIDYAEEAFAAMLPRTIQLPGTGVGLTENEQIDPNWQVVAIDGEPLDTPQALLVSGAATYTRLVPNDPARSQWIAWDPQIQQDHVCTLRTRITIPDEIDPDTTHIDLRYYADAQVQAIIVNGRRKALDIGPPVFGSWPEGRAQINEHLQSGVNEIELEVANLGPQTGGGADLVGLKLEWQLIGQADWKQPQ
ncbi:MAG: FecR family protein [Planctomycetota bacterium]